MVLEKRECPNCGSNSILEHDGTYVCMNCRTFFDNPNEIKITKIVRDEAKIERIKMEERERKRGDKLVIAFAVGLILFLVIGGMILMSQN